MLFIVTLFTEIPKKNVAQCLNQAIDFYPAGLNSLIN